MKKVFIFTNINKESKKDKEFLLNKLKNHNILVTEELTNDTDLIFCVGGDGTLLKLVQKLEFPTIPICGLNTGHLGFFQEIDSTNIDVFLDNFLKDDIIIQPYNIVKADIKVDGKTITHHALNEFVIRGTTNNLVHLGISINDSFIENFSGDGILISSPAGSTAYNYSLSGSLVDPRLNLIQVTPMAPMNTSAYRSLTSSILIPATDRIILKPQDSRSETLKILFDGEDEKYDNIEELSFILSKRKINLVLFGNLTFWDKVKEKFL